jgi:hypothetical protein
MSDILIWIILLFVFLIIIGLYSTSFTPLDLTEKQKILKLNNNIENFVSSNKQSIDIEHFSSTSSDTDRSQGASHYYNWGLPDSNEYNFDKEKCDDNHKCDHHCPRDCPLICPKKTVIVNNCTPRPKDINLNEVCNKCDITLNNDIDKYVLKSSVPACPDLSEFVTKNMINANPDLSDYILKSEIKPCPNIDLSKYILKSSVPPCPECPTCPECPICPVCPTCPPEKQCKKIYDYRIIEHPDINKYISKDELNKNYIKKSDIPKCDNSNIKDSLSNIFKKIKNNLFGKIEEQKKLIQELQNNYKNNEYNENNRGKSYNNENNKYNEYNRGKLYNNKHDRGKLYHHNNDDNYKSELLNNNIKGYYVGDSSFAGV